ncbi:hypothetical protein Vadar_017295 [Vaccinium darrowii]|uniref:Uncharacterized protein n=1 Tax=Vaccinium darrowii TaxID=229202 RepID=A0ACB7YWI2_9ERIC|nr:hypothetical protein Vadar_017295 [Vaccinium darrowii]
MFQGEVWRLHVDGESNSKGAEVGIVLVSPEGIIHENALTIGFPASNNEAKYEALISGLKMEKHLGAETVQVCSDSQLIVNQIKDQYNLKDPRTVKYYEKVWELIRRSVWLRSSGSAGTEMLTPTHWPSLQQLVPPLQTEPSCLAKLNIRASSLK